MVFLVFSEVPEMSSEVAGPGPTHGRSNLPELTRDLLLVQGQPAHDDNTTDQPPLLALTSCPSTTRWMLQAVLAQSFAWLDGTCGSSARAAFAPSWRCPQSSLFLYNFYKIQLSTGGIGATLLVVGEGPDVRLSRLTLHR